MRKKFVCFFVFVKLNFLQFLLCYCVFVIILFFILQLIMYEKDRPNLSFSWALEKFYQSDAVCWVCSLNWCEPIC